MLRHVLGDRPFRVVPILVSSFHELVRSGRSPGADPRVAGFVAALRATLAEDDVPTMIIHGDDDRILPADATSRRQAKLIKDVKYVEIKGGSHGITWTRAEEINAPLVEFLT